MASFATIAGSHFGKDHLRQLIVHALELSQGGLKIHLHGLTANSGQLRVGKPQLLLGPAVEDGNLFRTRLEAPLGSIHGHLSTADNNNALANGDFHTLSPSQRNWEQQVKAGDGLLQVRSQIPHKGGVPATRSQNHRLIALLKQGGHGEVFAEGFTCLGLHSHLEDGLNLPVENVSGQAGFGNDRAEKAAQFRHGFKYGG